jgi:deazaflavin-dependent oxidoreductase (nitroreductase family)
VAELRYVDPHRPRGALYRAICRLAITPIGMWLSQRIAWNLDPYLLRLTRGRFSSSWPVASGLLETRGARSGKFRRTATLYFHDGDRVTLVASYRGEPRNPAWYHNVLAHPEVVYGGRPFHAEVVSHESERARLWRLADQVFPQFADYRRWAAEHDRTIPIVQLVPW